MYSKLSYLNNFFCPLNKLPKKLVPNKAIQFVEELKQAKAAVIPVELLSDSFSEVSRIVEGQRKGRLQGLQWYPTLSTFFFALGNLPVAHFFIFSNLPICFIFHQVKIVNAIKMACDLMSNKEVFKDKNANALLREWIKENKIGYLSFNKNAELILCSKENLSNLTLLERVDKAKFNIIKPAAKKSKPFLLPKHSLHTNMISYFHLTEEMRKQIGCLLQARSDRFRQALLIAIASLALGSIPFIDLHPSSKANLFFVSLTLGIFSNCTVDREFQKLFPLLLGKDLFKIISPEYRQNYLAILNKNEPVKIIINSFGDIVINPSLSMRSRLTIKTKREYDFEDWPEEPRDELGFRN